MAAIRAKFICNITHPKDLRAIERIIRHSDETANLALLRRRLWLRNKLLGPPRQFLWYSVEQLEQLGYVGVYEACRDARPRLERIEVHHA